MSRIISRIVVSVALLFNVLFVFSQEEQRKKNEMVSEISPLEMNVSDNKLTLKNAPVGKQVVIYTIIGNKVRQIEIKSSNEEHELKLPRAIYIFKLEGVVKKFVIK
ncbi:MAG: T9SS type A sorting domain-containing protein [Dysgonamonadaceae bacterium]|jgi:hypothetical protein|nr:T9SS type A sorting domain-containing protein [Dysgonamonadaceae bacterium]